MALHYWIVSLPAEKSNLWNKLRESVSKNAFDTSFYKFNVPDLRVGTLDSLLALSDDLVKSNIFIEGVSHKIRCQIEELERVSTGEGGALTVDGVPVEAYITRAAIVRDETHFDAGLNVGTVDVGHAGGDPWASV